MIQKSKVLTLIVFGLLFMNLSAQEGDFSNDKVAKLPDEDRKFRFGLQFSPNISWFKTNRTGYESGGSEFGFSYGVSFEYFMTNNYLFSSGFSILNSGGKVVVKDADTSSYETTEDFNLKYVEIPLLLKLRTNEIGYLTYFGQFGFKAGINFSSNSTIEYESFTPLGLTPNGVPESTEINFLNLSLAIGIGVEYNISGNTSLVLGATFNNGFIDQLDGDPNANLNYVALNIGIYF